MLGDPRRAEADRRHLSGGDAGQATTFCKELEARKDAKTLLGHFNVVRGSGDKLEAVPVQRRLQGRR